MNNKLLSFVFGNLGVFSTRFLYFLILSFSLTIDNLAEFTTSLSINAIILCVCAYGNYNLFMRREAQGNDGGTLLGEYIISSLVFMLLFSGLLSIIAYFLPIIFGLNLKLFIMIFIAEFFFVSIPSLFKAFSLSKYDNNIFKDSITNIISALLILLATIFLFLYYGKNKVEIDIWVITYLAISILSFIIRVLFWHNLIQFPKLYFLPKMMKNQILSGHNFMFSSVLRNLYLNLDKILIYYFLGKEISGYYAIAYRFYNVFLMILNSISGVKEAKLYQLAENSFIRLKIETRKINKTTLKYFLYSLPLWLITALFIMFIYNQLSLYMFILLIIVCPFQLIAFSMLNVLNSIQYENKRLILILISCLSNILIVYALFDYVSWLAIIIGLLLSNIIIVMVSFVLLKNIDKYKHLN